MLKICGTPRLVPGGVVESRGPLEIMLLPACRYVYISQGRAWTPSPPLPLQAQRVRHRPVASPWAFRFANVTCNYLTNLCGVRTLRRKAGDVSAASGADENEEVLILQGLHVVGQMNQ